MKKYLKSILSILLVAACIVGLASTDIFTYNNGVAEVKAASTKASTVKAPKYVFLFIGDGMSYPQIQLTSDYLGAMSQKSSSTILKSKKALNFMNFEAAGSAITYDSTSFCPDSASTATSLSTGKKTYSGVINMDETKTISFETITEKLKKQLGYKIGIISSVNINHATPAAFFGHQASRNNYYELGLEMVASGFDYFAGGALKNPDGDKGNVYDLAKAAGYQVITTQAKAEALTKKAGKAIVIGETLADSDSLSYELDRKANEWSLADYVDKGIEVLDNKKRFLYDG